MLYTVEDVEAVLAAGLKLNDLPPGVRLTRDAARLMRERGAIDDTVGARPSVIDYKFTWEPGSDPQTPADIQDFFHSARIEAQKRWMCDIGRRMWEREYTDGNGGNLTVRVGDSLVLSTATMISKGFMEPEDICLVDLQGNQLAGTRRRTSECKTHLGIMRHQPLALACCHGHPAHATAFAVAKVQPPSYLIPEAEVFLGEIGMCRYATPGEPEIAELIGQTARQHMSILMENHGVITWGRNIEDAYWKLENTDVYCRTVWVSSQLGKPLTPISGPHARDLLELRRRYGMDDRRFTLRDDELRDTSNFQAGFVGTDEA